MNHSIEKIVLPSNEARFELRVWGREQGAIRRRFKTKEAVQTYLQGIYAERPDVNMTPVADPSLAVEYDYWMTTQAPKFAPGWLKNISGYWKELSPELGHLPVSQLTKSRIKLVEMKLLEKGNSAKTVNTKLGFVFSILSHSKSQERIAEHRLEAYKKMKVAKPLIEFWSAEERKSFLSYASRIYSERFTRWVYVAYLMAVSTGMRANEIWGLDWSQVQCASGLIDVTRQWDAAVSEFRVTKGCDARQVPLQQSLADELLKLPVDRREGLVFNHYRHPVCHRAFQRRFNRDVKNWGGQPISFHGMRHTAATSMLASGATMPTVQEILGHKSITTTQRYVHAMKEGVRDVASRYDALN